MSKFKSLIDVKKGKLLVQKEYKENGRWKVECLCDCGSKCVKLRCHVASGGTKSCGEGCNDKSGNKTHNWTGHGKISGDYWSSLKRGAIKRGLLFDISIEHGWELFVQQEGRCAVTGDPIGFVVNRRKNYSNQTASLDRRDSNKGYITGNVWWVHKKLNRLKSDFPLQELISLSKKIAINADRGVNYKKWDLRFLDLAKHISTWSKDPSTQVGAVIYDSRHRIISMGYNGLASGVNDVGLDDRERKYKTIIHAEMNAILFAGRDLTGCTVATWPFMPCSNCSSAIIQAGITRCVFPVAIGDKAARWVESFQLSKQQFREAGVMLVEYEI